MTDLLLTLTVLLLAANLVLMLLTNERIRNAIRDGNRQALEIGLARLEAKREEMARTVSVHPHEVVPLLNRLALEATGEQAGIDQVIKITASPVPAMVALGKGYQHYTFTPAPLESARRADGLLGDRPHKVPAHPINASTSGLTAVAELAAAWSLLAQEAALPPEQRVLPRTTQWYLYVVPQPTGGKPAR